MKVKTQYTKKGEPESKRVKAHVGDKIKFIERNSYGIPIGTKGKVIRVVRSVKPYGYLKYTDYHYKIKLDNGKFKWIMSGGTWKVII